MQGTCKENPQAYASDGLRRKERSYWFDAFGGRYISGSLQEVSKGEANKIFIPFEATKALSSLGAMSDVVKDKKTAK